MNKKFVNELNIGEKINDLFAITNANLSPFRPESGKLGSFLRCNISDRTGSLLAVMWENGEEAFSKIKNADVVVQIQGTVGQYRGETQVMIERLDIVDEANIDPTWFLAQSPRPLREMITALKKLVVQIKSGPLSWLINSLFQDEAFYRAFIQAPAAKGIHHAYLSGLLEHSLETAVFANTIAAQYPQYINRDLLLTGAILHDCGKIQEYSWKGVAISLTDEGKLFGHLVLGARLLEAQMAKRPDFPADLKQELLHMILAHHGIQEWGSPEPPKTVNAYALHHADYLSAQIAHFQNVLDTSSEQDGWTTKDYILGRSVYKGFLESGPSLRHSAI